MNNYKKIASALIGAVISMGATAHAAERCSSTEINRLKQAMFSEMNAQASSIVWLGSDESVQLSSCSRYSDGYLVEGRFHMYGTDDAYYWLDGTMVANTSLAPQQVRIDDYNSNFLWLTVIKGGLAVGTVVTACAASGEC